MASPSPVPTKPEASSRQATRQPGRPRAWWTYLACGAVVALAYYLVPATGLVPRWAAKIGLYNGLGLSAVAAIVVGMRWHRPQRPLTWYLFGVGLLSYVTADIIFYTYQDILHQEVFPSAADVFYLAAYPFLMAGLLLLISCPQPRRRPGQPTGRLGGHRWPGGWSPGYSWSGPWPTRRT
jgi:hypothetical protein